MTTENQKTVGLIHPVDWAINFAWSKKFTLFYLSLPCLLSEIITSYIGYNFPVTDKQTILLTIIGALPTAWLLGAIVLFSIQSCRGIPFELGTIALQALGYLPKVFFSYAAVFFIILFAVTNPLFILFIPFFVWAPAFAVCDIFAPNISPEEEEEQDIDYEEEDFISKPQKTSILFTAPWNIGLIRSINYSSRDIIPTVIICGFFWIALVIPAAITYLTMGQKISSAFIIIQHLLTTFSIALALGAWAALFIIMLPQQAKEELKIPSSIRLWDQIKGARLFIFYGKFLPLLITLTIGVVSTIFIFYQTTTTKDIPDNTKVHVNNAYIDGEQLTLRLVVYDSEYEMRWLLPNQFQIVLENPENKIEIPATTGTFNFLPQPLIGAISPDRDAIVVYDTEGREVSSDSLSPRSDALELVLRYPLPKPEDKGKGFLLYYRNIITGSHKGPLFRGIPKQ